MKKGLLYLLCVFGIIALSSCTKADNRDKISVTIVPEEAFVKAISSEYFNVITIVPPQSSPETYEPSPIVMQDFQNSKIYFAIGVPTEKAHILSNVSKDTTVIHLENEVGELRKFENGETDPHLWLSISRVKKIIKVIASALIELAPNQEAYFLNNMNQYLQKLDETDIYIKNQLSMLKTMIFICFHPAFGYFADDYGLEMYALEKNGKEATPSHLQAMIQLAKDNDIKVIFYQEEVDSRESQAFAEEIEGKAVALSPLSFDYIDNLRKMADLIKEANS